MRCLALAQGWQEAGGAVRFVMAAPAEPFRTRLESEGMEVEILGAEAGSAEDAAATVERALASRARWVVLDGYHFSSGYQQVIRNAGLRQLAIDDHGALERYYADVVLNQNLDATEGLYRNRERGALLLLGARYALLRREFRRWQWWQRETPRVARKVLVTLGGGDAGDVTRKAMQAVERIGVEGIEARVVISASNSHYQQLATAAKRARTPMRLERDVSDMAEAMVWADVAVAAGGSSCWEMLFLQLSGVLVVSVRHQRQVVESLAGRGLFCSAGWWRQAAAERIAACLEQRMRDAGVRQRAACQGRLLVDGGGVQRVLAALDGMG